MKDFRLWVFVTSCYICHVLTGQSESCQEDFLVGIPTAGWRVSLRITLQKGEVEGVGASRCQDRHAAQESTGRRKCRRDPVGVAGTRERRVTHRAGGAAQVELVQTQLVLKLMLLNICGLFPPSCSSWRLQEHQRSFHSSLWPLEDIWTSQLVMKINLEQLSEVRRKAVKCARVTAPNKTSVHPYFFYSCANSSTTWTSNGFATFVLHNILFLFS